MDSERTLHLIDVENLLCTPNPAPGDVRALESEYRRLADVGEDDHVVVACSHHCARRVWFEWDPSARRLVRSGHNGADSALLDLLAAEHPEERYTRIVIGSGDGAFAEVAATLTDAGVDVEVVAPPTGISGRLRASGAHVRLLARALTRGRRPQA